MEKTAAESMAMRFTKYVPEAANDGVDASFTLTSEFSPSVNSS